MSGGIVYYPGEVKTYKTKAAAAGCFDRPGIVVKKDTTTASDVRVTKIAASGDVPFGVCVQDTYNQDESIIQSGVAVGVVSEGVVMVAVEAGTYRIGDRISCADTTDGYGRADVTGVVIGISEEYKVIATGDYTDRTDQLAVRLMLGEGSAVT